MKNRLYIYSIAILFFACQNNNSVDCAPRMELSPKTNIIIAHQGGVDKIILTTNSSWSSSIDANWVDISPESGSVVENHKIVVTVDSENDTASDREAKIVFVCKDISTTVIVKQLKRTEDVADGVVNVILSNTNTSPQIIKNVVGFNNIYSHYGDAFWQNSGIKSAVTTMNTSFLRWPGGAPTNRYHWSNLNGQGWKDNWDPEYNPSSDMPATAFTDLDEHIAICSEVGATPLIGINQGSGLKWNRVAEALAEAKALVQYCKDKNYNVEYYYLDNEPYHAGANYKMSWQEYVEQINMYAPAIKEINPDAKIVINWEKVRPASLWNILRDAGDNIDVVEVHFYWDNGQVTFENWCGQHPMNSVSQWYAEGGTYVEEIEFFYEKCKLLGYNHIKFASLEWNVGKSATLADYPTKYENTIMQAEMLMQFIDGGLEFATFWPIFWPKLPNDKKYSPNRYLMDPTKGYELSPSFDMFTMLSEAMDKDKFEVVSSDKTIYSLAVGSTNRDAMVIYTHSKSNLGRWINLYIPQYDDVVFELLQPDTPELISGKKEVQPTTSITYDTDGGCYKYYLPPYSLGQVKLNK